MDPEMKRLLEQLLAEQRETNRLLNLSLEMANTPTPDWSSSFSSQAQPWDAARRLDHEVPEPPHQRPVRKPNFWNRIRNSTWW